MFIRPLTRISKGEKIMTFIVRPRVGITNITFQHIIKKKVVVRPRMGIACSYQKIQG